MSPPIEVIINAGSGSVSVEDTKLLLEEGFEAHGVDAHIQIAKNGPNLLRLAKMAAESDAEVIVAGGGDGTISAVAAEVIKAGKVLGVLPLGTLNNFSKDLQIPPDLTEAIRVIVGNHVKKIDVGEVNGQTFINNSSIGLYPRIVRRRVKQQQKLGRGKWAAAAWAAWKVIRFAPLLRVRLMLHNMQFLRKTPFVFVGNNEYEMDFFKVGRRAALDEGELSVYFLRRGGRWGLVMLILRTIFGRLRQAKDFEGINTDEITIQTRKKRLWVAFDGEVAQMETPLIYKVIPLALNVIVPAESGAEPAEGK
jgi:diacylglycerol kinase family enzyme